MVKPNNKEYRIKKSMEGQVLFGVNNIFTVSASGVEYLCRIKGKVLKEEAKQYNPLAAGDFVEIEEDPVTEKVGWIYERKKRKNALIRWNRKRKAPQIIAANIDLLMALCSVKAPPFRPRFIDRLVISGEMENIEVVIVVNKCDLGIDPAIKKRLDDFQNNGYKVIQCSAKTGEGVDEVIKAIHNKVAVFSGQSGVGKTSLLNRINPELNLKTCAISNKYNRGVHTTCFSILVSLENGSKVIDTPGIREYWLYNLTPEELKFYFPEFTKPAKDCAYNSCLHLNEPNCRVKELVLKGKIHPDRYDSYTRIYQSIKQREKEQ